MGPALLRGARRSQAPPMAPELIVVVITSMSRRAATWPPGPV